MPSPALAEPDAQRRTEVARSLGVSVSTVDRLIADGRLPVIRCGRVVLVPRAAVLALLLGQPAQASAHE